MCEQAKYQRAVSLHLAVTYKSSHASTIPATNVQDQPTEALVEMEQAVHQDNCVIVRQVTVSKIRFAHPELILCLMHHSALPSTSVVYPCRV